MFFRSYKCTALSKKDEVFPSCSEDADFYDAQEFLKVADNSSLLSKQDNSQILALKKPFVSNGQHGVKLKYKQEMQSPESKNFRNFCTTAPTLSSLLRTRTLISKEDMKGSDYQLYKSSGGESEILRRVANHRNTLKSCFGMDKSMKGCNNGIFNKRNTSKISKNCGSVLDSSKIVLMKSGPHENLTQSSSATVPCAKGTSVVPIAEGFSGDGGYKTWHYQWNEGNKIDNISGLPHANFKHDQCDLSFRATKYRGMDDFLRQESSSTNESAEQESSESSDLWDNALDTMNKPIMPNERKGFIPFECNNEMSSSKGMKNVLEQESSAYDVPEPVSSDSSDSWDNALEIMPDKLTLASEQKDVENTSLVQSFISMENSCGQSSFVFDEPGNSSSVQQTSLNSSNLLNTRDTLDTKNKPTKSNGENESQHVQCEILALTSEVMKKSLIKKCSIFDTAESSNTKSIQWYPSLDTMQEKCTKLDKEIKSPYLQSGIISSIEVKNSVVQESSTSDAPEPASEKLSDYLGNAFDTKDTLAALNEENEPQHVQCEKQLLSSEVVIKSSVTNFFASDASERSGVKSPSIWNENLDAVDTPTKLKRQNESQHVQCDLLVPPSEVMKSSCVKHFYTSDVPAEHQNLKSCCYRNKTVDTKDTHTKLNELNESQHVQCDLLVPPFEVMKSSCVKNVYRSGVPAEHQSLKSYCCRDETVDTKDAHTKLNELNESQHVQCDVLVPPFEVMKSSCVKNVYRSGVPAEHQSLKSYCCRDETVDTKDEPTKRNGGNIVLRAQSDLRVSSSKVVKKSVATRSSASDIPEGGSIKSPYNWDKGMDKMQKKSAESTERKEHSQVQSNKPSLPAIDLKKSSVLESSESDTTEQPSVTSSDSSDASWDIMQSKPAAQNEESEFQFCFDPMVQSAKTVKNYLEEESFENNDSGQDTSVSFDLENALEKMLKDEYDGWMLTNNELHNNASDIACTFSDGSSCEMESVEDRTDNHPKNYCVTSAVTEEKKTRALQPITYSRKDTKDLQKLSLTEENTALLNKTILLQQQIDEKKLRLESCDSTMADLVKQNGYLRLELDTACSEQKKFLDDINSAKRMFCESFVKANELLPVLKAHKEVDVELREKLRLKTEKVKRKAKNFASLKDEAENTKLKLSLELEKARATAERELTRLHAKYIRDKMAVDCLQSSLQDQQQEKHELAKLCDELVANSDHQESTKL